MQDNLNKTALVTGATSDIGVAIARHLARGRFNLLLTGRRMDRLRTISEELEKLGVKSAALPADIATPNGVSALARSVRIHLEHWKSALSVLIHVAGVWHDNDRALVGRDFLDTDITEIENVLNVSLFGAVYLTKHLLDLMPHQQNAKIIGISGTFPLGGAGWLHYFLAKQGLELFIAGLASELHKHEIQANCVSPSYVATDPLKQFFPDAAKAALEPEEVAEVVDFLVSPAARNITGQVIIVKSGRAGHERL
jgi:NAD(P)-dependent dehydrogenase (short-subunit alcohol dehydrogenase family)